MPLYLAKIRLTFTTQALKEWRRDEWKKPVDPIRTEDYLRQNDYFTFYHTPDELKGKPNYYLSDVDRLYWWDGTEEVRIAAETEEWLRKMAEHHKEIMRTIEIPRNSLSTMQVFLKLLEDINEYYWRIFPFESMFYDFIQNISRIEYAAAIELLRQVADEKETREAGEIIRYRKSMKSGSKNVIENAGASSAEKGISCFGK